MENISVIYTYRCATGVDVTQKWWETCNSASFVEYLQGEKKESLMLMYSTMVIGNLRWGKTDAGSEIFTDMPVGAVFCRRITGMDGWFRVAGFPVIVKRKERYV